MLNHLKTHTISMPTSQYMTAIQRRVSLDNPRLAFPYLIYRGQTLK